MYVTTMWVRNPTKDRGVNIFIHWHPNGLRHIGDPWKIVDDPGPPDRRHHNIQITPGGNSVDAFLDVILEDEDYTPDLIERALDSLERSLKLGDKNPLKWSFDDGRREVYIVFSVNVDLEDLDTRRVVFALLRENLTTWLARALPALPPVSERAAA